MSAFWSSWVKFLVVLNLGITLFLFLWALRVRIPTLDDGTTGHTWAHVGSSQCMQTMGAVCVVA